MLLVPSIFWIFIICFISCIEAKQCYFNEGSSTFPEAENSGNCPFISVDTEKGQVVGRLYTSSQLTSNPDNQNLTTVATWLGIPFAQPPVGSLRFHHPIPPKSWSKPLKAWHYSPSCFQNEAGLPSGKVALSEDCLYLNVFRPYSSQDRENGKFKTLLPVIMMIHGGGFSHGGATIPKFHTSDRLAVTTNSVVVTFNYRLGVFGFFVNSHLASQNETNFGIQDVISVLYWIHRNIEDFGGDPQRIHLMGFSAGAFMACGLATNYPTIAMVSSVSLHSGHCMANPTPLGYAIEAGDYIINKTSCGRYTDPEERLGCLHYLNFQEIYKATPARRGLFYGTGYNHFPIQDDFLLSSHGVYNIESAARYSKLRVENFEKYFDEIAHHSLLFHNYPEYQYIKKNLPTTEIIFMMGSVTDEGTLFTRIAFPVLTSFSIFNQDHEMELLRASFNDSIAERLEKVYDSHGLRKGSTTRLSRIIGDYVFSCPIDTTARTMHQHGLTVYYYLWDHTPSFSKAPILGKFHGGEEPFIFQYSRWKMHQGSFTEEEIQLSNTFLQLLSITLTKESLPENWKQFPDILSLSTESLHHFRDHRLEECLIFSQTTPKPWWDKNPCHHGFGKCKPNATKIPPSLPSPPGSFCPPAPIPTPKSVVLFNKITIALYLLVKQASTQSFKTTLRWSTGFVFIVMFFKKYFTRKKIVSAPNVSSVLSKQVKKVFSSHPEPKKKLD